MTKISSTDVPLSISRQLYYSRWKKAFEEAILTSEADLIIRSGEIVSSNTSLPPQECDSRISK